MESVALNPVYAFEVCILGWDFFWFILNRSSKKKHGFLCNSMSQIIILASHLLKPIDSFEFVWVPEIFINSLIRMKTSQHFSFETPSVSLSFYLRLKKAASKSKCLRKLWIANNMRVYRWWYSWKTLRDVPKISKLNEKKIFILLYWNILCSCKQI